VIEKLNEIKYLGVLLNLQGFGDTGFSSYGNFLTAKSNIIF